MGEGAVPYYGGEVTPFIDAGRLAQRVRELGEGITGDYQGCELTLLSVLKGSVFFTADLARAIDLPLTLEFLGVSSYSGTETTGEVRITSDATQPLAGRHILVVEDIVDTGLTMKFLMENLKARRPASVKICTLLEKPSRARTRVDIDYRGFVVEDVFVVGYGLDFDGRYRNLPFSGLMEALE